MRQNGLVSKPILQMRVIDRVHNVDTLIFIMWCDRGLGGGVDRVGDAVMLRRSRRLVREVA